MVSITAAEEVLLTLHSSTICFPCSPRLRKAWVFSHACSVEGIRLTLRALQSVSATYRLGADEADISAIVLLDRLLLDLLRHVSSLIHLPKCTCRVPPLSPRLSMPPLCALLLLLSPRESRPPQRSSLHSSRPKKEIDKSETVLKCGHLAKRKPLVSDLFVPSAQTRAHTPLLSIGGLRVDKRRSVQCVGFTMFTVPSLCSCRQCSPGCVEA